MNLSIALKTETVTTPDAEFRIKSAWRLLADMILKMAAAERDSKEIPVELPQESLGLPSPTKNTAIIQE